MARNNLSGRLSRLRKAKEEQSRPMGETPENRKVSAPAEKPVREQGTGLPGWELLGRYTYFRRTVIDNPLADGVRYLLQDVPETDLLFIDSETTGLSGGAGTYIFLFGIGRLRGSVMEIDQYFLGDLPGEAEFLGFLDKVLPSEAVYVSYNGRSFDMPLLRTRFIMNGFLREFPKHLDLLYSARRLWRTLLESCSLGTIENRILNIHRAEDLPSAEVPERYFRYLKKPEPGLLSEVFAHHKEDISSLALLLNRIEEILKNPFEEDFVDLRGAGRILSDAGDKRVEDILRFAMKKGNRAAGRDLGIFLKREKRYDDASDVWRFLWDEYKSPFCGIELAKDLEHRGKNYMGAAEIVREIMVSPWARDKKRKDALVWRLMRLERKEKSTVNPDDSNPG